MSKLYLIKNKYLVVLLLFVSNLAYSQNAVTGKVLSSEDNTGLPGVSVVEKGTTNGTVTNVDGDFTISVNPNATLVFSFVGFKTQEVSVGTRTSLNVTLATDIEALSEVVVIGYGRQEKKDVTGSVVSLSPKDFNKGVINSPEQLLQGRAPGVQVNPSSGEPGAPIIIRIRGAASPRGNNSPLFVIDGIPLSGNDVSAGTADYGQGVGSARNPLNFLNPDDIENISVLKDASATAIYGSRGANGVVLISTKQGKANQPMLSFSASASASTIQKKYDLVEADDFVAAAVAQGGDATAVDEGGSTDWQDEILRTGITQNYSIAYGGGTEDSRYRFSLGYMDQEGIVETTGLERLSGRLNSTHNFLNKKFQVDLTLGASQIIDHNAPLGNNAGYEGNLIGAALLANPTRPVRNPDGSYVQKSNDARNSVAMLDYIDDNTKSIRLLGGLAATWNITNWLNFKTFVALDNSTSTRRVSIDRRLNWNNIVNIGRAYILNVNTQNKLIENTFNLNKELGKTRLEAVLGYSYQDFENNGNIIEARNFPNDTLPYNYVDNIGGANNTGEARAYTAGSSRNVEKLVSFFGRVNLNFAEKFNVTATLRQDGSTKFGENNKWGLFPSFAANWVLSEEEFTPELFSDLKLRAGWGITGNQEFPGSASKTLQRYTNDLSLTVINSYNPNLQWEETKQLNVGVDFGFFGGRLFGSFDFFDKGTTNLIILKDYPQPASVGQRYENIGGTIKNTGIELSLDYRVLEGGDFTWGINYNMAYVHNIVKGLDAQISTAQVNGQGLTGAYAQRIQSGQSMYSFYLREFTGYTSEGLGTYADNEALGFHGDALPDWTFGLTNNFGYKNFDASIFFTAQTGFMVYNNTANAIFLKGNLRNGKNVTKDVASSPESPANFGEASTRFLEKGDFIRLANVTLGYNFNLGNTGIKSLRLAVTGQNLLLFTKYTGINPEVSTNVPLNGVPSLGMDYLAYPSARTFTIGLTAGF
ncbi:MAG TPA: SusC/RagA family TonB-linked outer membrane protein [Cytophagales bacterium]|nr:SusC/RagA family TonB-linked outer membrane protein [Cytophagales bacterium]